MPLSPHPLESYISQGCSRGIRHSSSYFWLHIFSLKSIISFLFFFFLNDSSKSLCKNWSAPAVRVGVFVVFLPLGAGGIAAKRAAEASLAVLLPTTAATVPGHRRAGCGSR